MSFVCGACGTELSKIRAIECEPAIAEELRQAKARIEELEEQLAQHEADQLGACGWTASEND